MGRRDVQIVGSSIAAFHVARFLCDKAYNVSMTGFHPQKFVDKIWLVRDVSNFKYMQGETRTAFPEMEAIVYFREESITDLDAEFEKFKRYVQYAQDTSMGNSRLRFIFVSSDLVYGNQSEPATEEVTPKPDTPEGQYYLKMEEYLKASKLKKWVILRPAEIYGEGIYSKIHEFAQKCIAGEDFKVADNKRDFTYIWNLSEVILRCIQKAANVDGETYNVSNDHPVRYLGLGNAIAAIIGTVKKIDNNKHTVNPICKVNIDENVTGMENIVVDIKKMKKKLKYDPTYNNTLTTIQRRVLPFELNYLSELTQERQLELIKRL
jgi:nucleoside-diphosphate-sugar epimerase